MATLLALAGVAALAVAALLVTVASDRRQRHRLRALRRALHEQHEHLVRDVQQNRTLIGLLAFLWPRAPLPPLVGWAIRPDAARILLDEILDRRPRTVVECGSGSSTVLIAYVLEQLGTGEVIALEHDQAECDRTGRALARHGLATRGRAVHAPLRTVAVGGTTFQWYDPDALSSLRDIDLLLVDGPPGVLQSQARYPALPLLWDRLAPGALIILEDVARADERTIAERWAREFPGLALRVFPTEKGTALLQRR